MTKRVRLRTLLFGGIMTLLFLVLIGRIYYVQVVDAKWYDLAKERWAAADKLVAKRGTITDRDGNMLAMDTIAYNISVNPKVIYETGIQEEVIDGLHDILGISKDVLKDVVTAKRENGEFYVQRELRQGGWQIEKSIADEVVKFKDDLTAKLRKEKKSGDSGIYLQETLKRFYPRHHLASQMVGYVSLDKERMTGAEAYFNDLLTGEDGYIRYEKDGHRVQLSKGDVDYKPAVNGQNIALTIDSDIQYYTEEALREIVEMYAPKSATAIAADPNTMEILALANMPDFNPNKYWESPDESFYNHAVWSLYEPGSTSKIMTLAAAVEEGVFDPDDTYMSGSIKVQGDPTPIRDHNRNGWGEISYLDGLKYSSNVAFVKLGFEQLGGEKLRDYYRLFGFGQKTGIEMANELSGVVRFQYNRDIAAAAFGQGVSVTAIQQVTAVAAVANGGKLMEPHIVKSITDPSTMTTTIIEPKMVRRVISEQTSRLVNEYLEQVVSDQEKGTGRNAYIEGYRVAGKTGTAQKFINGKPSDTKFLVSFIGYAPVDNPKIVVYILVDEPNDPTAGGGRVAAPAFREIVLKSLRKMGVAPNWVQPDGKSDGEASVAVPDLIGLKVLRAKTELTAKGTGFELVGNGGEVLQQIPAPGTVVHPTQRLYLITEQRDKLAVPDLTGVSLRDALELCSIIGAKLAPQGSGYVVSQKVEERNGERIITVQLSPPVGSEGYIDPDTLAGEADEGENGESSEEDSDDDGGEESEEDQDRLNG